MQSLPSRMVALFKPSQPASGGPVAGVLDGTRWSIASTPGVLGGRAGVDQASLWGRAEPGFKLRAL